MPLQKSQEFWRLYRLAHTRHTREFEIKALRMLSLLLDFDGAVWGEGSQSPHGLVNITRAVVFHKPQELLDEYAQLPVADPVSCRFIEQPQLLQRVDATAFYSCPALEPIKLFLARHGIGHLMLQGMEQAHEGALPLAWLTVYRSPYQAPFSQQDATDFEAWLPHLFQAQHICRKLNALQNTPKSADPAPSRVWVPPEQAVSLTQRQHELLRFLALGLTYQEAARQMGISAHTVKEHASNLYAKLGVKNKTEAIFEGRLLRLIS
jgi:DNA-binding CsgD family transcriptional regulator